MKDFMGLENKSYIESKYQLFLQDPDSVEESWRYFFLGANFTGEAQEGAGSIDSENLQSEFNTFRLIQSYRARGHLIANTNPIRKRIDRDARLTLATYNLKEEDLQKSFSISAAIGLKNGTLKEVIDKLNNLYCQHIGIEYMHISDTEIRRWVRDKFEKTAMNINHSIDKKKIILKKLNQAVIFEKFLQSKYIGQKRFSLEGGESTIPGLNALIEKGSELGAKEVIFGMAHRGRLNVLANIIGKTYEFIFDEFDGDKVAASDEDDVKYHLGFSSVKKTSAGNEVFLKIMSNPSHLEVVSSTTVGYTRALQEVSYKGDSSKVLPIVIHGDAAIAGQGIAYEMAQMSKLDAYQVGGTIHFIINNQIGFTTDFHDARSSHYCTSVAKTVDAPILHVNGDDPEAVVFACEFAAEFRHQFKQDIYIDMVCYRKYGHNEGDEPKYTQPHLYGLVAKHENPLEIYTKKLLGQDQSLKNLTIEMQAEFKKELDNRFNNVKQKTLPDKVQGPHKEWLKTTWAKPEDFLKSPKTAVSKSQLEAIVKKITEAPEGFHVLKKAKRILDERKKRYEEEKIDWALAEMFAFGSLLLEGNSIRFSGQDVIRGTFSHRHAKIFDEQTNETYCGLNHIKKGQSTIQIYNSLLSEYAVLGFEYGHSLTSPHSLTLWEAQFGDFTNGAQIVIDQFISSAEHKWRRMSGLVLLLPHGHEGQGPEHSSARPERFLQMAAKENIVVANCTTPANLFHILRRQLTWNFRKPLVIFTPKSLLRHPQCVSKISDFTDISFQEIIDDNCQNTKAITRVIVCSGKIYYDLIEAREKQKANHVAIVRLEQLYPLAEKQLSAILKKYPAKAEKLWVQEEPANMGPNIILPQYEVFKDFECLSRPRSSSPATGFSKTHLEEQNTIIQTALK